MTADLRPFPERRRIPHCLVIVEQPGVLRYTVHDTFAEAMRRAAALHSHGVAAEIRGGVHPLASWPLEPQPRKARA